MSEWGTFFSELLSQYGLSAVALAACFICLGLLGWVVKMLFQLIRDGYEVQLKVAAALNSVAEQMRAGNETVDAYKQHSDERLASCEREVAHLKGFLDGRGYS